MSAPAALTTDDGALDWVRGLLRPEPAERTGPSGTPARWAVLPSARHPRLFVPLGAPRAAAAALDRDTGLGGAKRAVASAAFRTGLVPPGLGSRLDAPAGGGLTAWLAERIDADPADLALALSIGPPRPNRKVVVQVLRRDGTTLAWVKVACSALTEHLVANEATWLARAAAGDGAVEAPATRARDTFRGHGVLITEPLPDRRRSAPFAVTPPLLLHIADLLPGGIVEVAGSTWWRATVARAAEAGHRAAIAAVELLATRFEAFTWRFGAWHGDLTRWNARICGDLVQVWDWERADGDRPVGFDAAHAAFQDAQVARGLDVASAAAEADASVAGLLPLVDLDPAAAPHLVSAYLLERWLRWAEDARLGSSTATTARHDAMLSVVTERLGPA